MTKFKAVTVRKGDTERIARTPVELVQFEHDGFKAVEQEQAPKSTERSTPAPRTSTPPTTTPE